MRGGRLHIVVFEKDGVATTSRGADAALAVVNHYDEMDMYCSPQDPDMHEEFDVSVYAIPDDMEEKVAAAIDGLKEYEICAYVEALATKNPAVRCEIVDVVYTMRGASAVIRQLAP
ncbi:hypothetical protein [Sphingopyxis chilensis]